MEHSWLIAEVVTSLDPSGIPPSQWLNTVMVFLPGHSCLRQNSAEGQRVREFLTDLAETSSELRDMRLFLSTYFLLSLYRCQTYLATWGFSLPIPALFHFSLHRWFAQQISCLWYLFARTAVIKYYTPGDLDNRNLFSHRSGGWKPKDPRHQQVWFLLGPLSSLACYVLTWFFFCVRTSQACLSLVRTAVVLA